ncbi:hypothetical protein MTQ13_03055 [Streptomyces sp. XM4011]|uniref:hypothetical protein n=1 Tax=Streptomyces sp. XM4011 TaxID=2929780 RepID=UPI001FF938EA|nr:hypothetical protein [Streptomyces sp. XM4011]MCK1813260.1 hypothetical protein [Streptomyces sp. XM4011]
MTYLNPDKGALREAGLSEVTGGGGGDIPDGSVGTDQLADGAVTAAKLASGAIPSGAAAGTPSLRALGTGATQAAAGNHTHTGLLTGSASAVANATDEASAVTQLNALLAVLRTRGVIST